MEVDFEIPKGLRRLSLKRKAQDAAWGSSEDEIVGSVSSRLACRGGARGAAEDNRRRRISAVSKGRINKIMEGFNMSPVAAIVADAMEHLDRAYDVQRDTTSMHGKLRGHIVVAAGVTKKAVKALALRATGADVSVEVQERFRRLESSIGNKDTAISSLPRENAAAMEQIECLKTKGEAMSGPGEREKGDRGRRLELTSAGGMISSPSVLRSPLSGTGRRQDVSYEVGVSPGIEYRRADARSVNRSRTIR